MKKSVKIIIIITIILTIIGIVLFPYLSKHEYSSNLFFMDTYINIKVNTTKSKAKQAFKEAENLFSTYHNLTNRYDETSELYKLNHTSGKLKVDSRLYDLISYGINWYQLSEGLFNINMGSIIDVWLSYRNKSTGLPTFDELNKDVSIDNIVLLGHNEILNKGANLDLGGYTKGYVTKLVGQKLESLGIKDYIINSGGNVLVGKKSRGKYSIGIESPNESGQIYKVIKGEEVSVVTSGGYERFFEYDGKKYHHIIDPKTKYPSNYMKSVTIITKDSGLADVLSTTVFLMPIEKGMEYIDSMDGVEAIWFTNDDEIITSKGIKNYE